MTGRGRWQGGVDGGAPGDESLGLAGDGVWIVKEHRFYKGGSVARGDRVLCAMGLGKWGFAGFLGENIFEFHGFLVARVLRASGFRCATVDMVCGSEKFEKDVRTVFNNSYKGLKGVADKGKDRLYIETENGRVVPVDGVRGRYVRVWSNGSTSDRRNHVIELEVYGVRDQD